MADRVAIVTGAGRGIGRATALHLAQRGWRVALVARTWEQLEETRRLLPDPAAGLPISADVTQPKAVADAVNDAVAAFGRLDAVVHSAGVAPVQKIEITELPEWQHVMDTNLTAAFTLARAAWPHLKKSTGSITLVSSFAARDPLPGFLAYAAAKAGVNGFALALAKEGAPLGIRVHVVAPGSVETQMFRNLVSEKEWPSNKTLDPKDVAAVIADCADGPLRHTSGEVIWMSKS